MSAEHSEAKDSTQGELSTLAEQAEQPSSAEHSEARDSTPSGLSALAEQPTSDEERAEPQHDSVGAVDARGAATADERAVTSTPATRGASARTRRRHRHVEPDLDRFDERPSRFLRTALLSLLLLAATAMGGVQFNVALVLSIVALLLAIATLRREWHHGAAHEGGRITLFSWFGMGLLAWCGLTLLQALPLPIGLVEWVSPDAAAVHREAAALVGETAQRASFSLAPSRSAAAVWPLIGASSCFLVAFSLFRRQRAFQWVFPRLVLVGLAFFGLSLLQTGFFSDTVLGIFEVSFVPPTPLRTPLLNANNAAAFFGVFALLCLGLGFSGKDRSRRGVFFFGYGVFSVAILMTLSRGSILAWGIAHLGFVLVMLLARVKLRAWQLLLVLLAFFSVIGAGLYTAEKQLAGTFDEMREAIDLVPEDLRNEMLVLPEGLDAPELIVQESIQRIEDHREHEKLIIYRDLYPLVEHYRWMGIGRGAFVDVYPSVATHGMQGRFRHVENEALEVLVEYGVLWASLGLLMLVVAVLSLFRRNDWKRSDRPLVAGALSALLFLMQQNLFDFSLRYPAVSFLFFSLLGILWGRAHRYQALRRFRRTDAGQTPRRRERLAWPALLLSVLLLLGSVLLLPHAKRAASESDFEDLQQMVESEELNLDALLSQARGLLSAHPSSSQARLLVAVGLFRLGEAELGAEWLQSALRYNPSDFRVHLLLGRYACAQSEFEQCAHSLRRAASLHRGPSSAPMRTAASELPDIDTLRLSLSAEPADWTLLGRELLREERFAEAFELADFLVAAHPEQLEGLDLQVSVAMALDMPEAAIEPMEQMLARFPQHPRVFQRRSQIDLALGDLSSAHLALLNGLDRHPKDVSLLFARADLLIRRGKSLFVNEAEWSYQCEQALDQLRPAALSRRPTAYGYHILRAHFANLRGESRQALNEYKVAHRLNPKAAAPLRGAVLAAVDLGAFEEANRLLDVYSRLADAPELAKLARIIDERRKTALQP
ncbi:MAG: O-antigen ligase family protein [Myxococcota bacterium]|jgi:tetratricopeptide (TPR) repeat protein|nr:O-antigen ligase family protein [Myxococcota bacterium]